MEEVEDIIPDIPEAEEFPEEVEIIETAPEPPPLKRATNKLKDKVTCEGCGKVCLYMRTSIRISVKRVHLMSRSKKSSPKKKSSPRRKTQGWHT